LNDALYGTMRRLPHGTLSANVRFDRLLIAILMTVKTM
jgi:hypothetical protein